VPLRGRSGAAAARAQAEPPGGKARVAVVGLGAMGARIARRLVDAGHDVTVVNRTGVRTAPLVACGAVAAATPAEAARLVDAMITVVADPVALAAVATGSNGIVAGARPGLLVIQMSTVGPAAVRELRAALPPEVRLVDAPMLGSVGEAESGRLIIFAGGRDEDIAAARPLLEPLGSVVDVGALGSGAAAKLVANAALLGTVALLGEVIALGRALGLDEEALSEVLAATPLAAQAERRRPAIASGDYPQRFALRLARKDAGLIAGAAQAHGRDLRLLDAARTWLEDAEAAGWGERDYTSVLARILDEAEESRRGAVPAATADVRDYDGLIVDLDGVVWLGREPVDGAVAAVAALRDRGTRLVFLTNDPSSSRDEQVARLAAIGIAAGADDVVTAATATARYLAGRADLAGRPAFVIGSPAFKQEIADAGFALVAASAARRAEVVAVGGHSELEFAELRAATRAVANGAELVAAGRDRIVPTADGPEPATGAVVAALEFATGAEATVVGKPEPLMFELAREALHGCRRIAVVGDNLASDIAGAKRAGLAALLVLTGASAARDVAAAGHKPDLVLASLGELASRR
jgi:3-hydroxyisobutyrate dehydrogenase